MSQKSQVLVVDDDLAMCGFLRTFLDARSYGATTVTSADEAMRRFHAERPAAVLLDVVMPGIMDGLDALAAFRKIDKDIPIIVISGEDRTSVVVQAMRLGATDFLRKPFQDGELEVVLDKALKQHQLVQEVAALRAQPTEPSHYTMLFGDSRPMTDVRDLIDRVSDTDVTVLIRGESGTGKELVARALHEQSLRKDRPFVKVNCGVLPAELLESDLFGFEKGAFAGAVQQQQGKFEFANHGTMFLDEIGDMGLPLQGKLLQALQDGEFSRLGGKAEVHVDVRVIAATNCDLEAAVASVRFREDLYFRLNVVTIMIPPLRERREEIPLLTDHFLKKYAAQYNKPCPSVSADLSRLFAEFDWPGNVRQLEHLIKRMVVLGNETAIVHELQTAPPLRLVTSPPAVAAAASAPEAVASAPSGTDAAGHVSLKDIARTAARAAECELILRMLTRTHWNRKEAAGMLGISYKALLYKIKESGLDKAS